MSRYVDVFISHKLEDLALAQTLGARIESLGYTCYIDAADAALKQVRSTAELAEHIRSHLRQARSLLFLSTTDSVRSKWMPWELGFFDGRWGSPTVGLYIFEARRSRKRRGPTPKSPAGATRDGQEAISMQEYLDIYERVNDDTLPAFLARATSNESLGNRQDVDVDRFMTLLISAVRNPLAFQIGWTQYLLGTLRPLLQANPLADRQLEMVIDALRGLRAAAESSSSSTSGGPVTLDLWQSWFGYARQLHAGGADASGGSPAAAPSNGDETSWQKLLAMDFARVMAPGHTPELLAWMRNAALGGVAGSAMSPHI